ncbi:MAG: 4-alpha-glucanotransferase [Bacteroidales bacterium]|nr:4-alpha-glucanotransferase [Bacteroidales bacterium]
MKITFNISYHTRWGETLYVYGDCRELGSDNPVEALEMRMSAPGKWDLTVDVPSSIRTLRYRFVVKAEHQAWRFEWGEHHHLEFGDKAPEALNLFDIWQDVPSDKPYYSSAFVDGMLHRQHRDQTLRLNRDTVNIRVYAPMDFPGETVAITGEGKTLGDWNPAKALRMNDGRFPLWEINIPKSSLKTPFEYKFIIINSASGELKEWEYGGNRIFGITFGGPDETIVVDALRFNNPRNNWKGAGTAIPVFSLRSEHDFGAGDFIDLKEMIDWCVLTGQKILQTLPVNDTTKTHTWTDSYPYSANSTFALHPMYLRLEAVGKLHDSKRREYYLDLARELNSLPEIDYERVMRGKYEYMREIYSEIGAETERNEDYRHFVERNEKWLKPYSVWCALRDEHHTCDHTRWGDMSRYDDKKVDAYMAAHPFEIGLNYFIQYHLDRQLRDVRDYAHQNGVVLKGDIPIGIGRESVDAWRDPRLFNMDCQAGAPPDAFSTLGQNWGFPTYNWDEMARDGFAWWKARFRKMSEYFDAYRIDHILGFFRIWQIPISARHGLLGYFNPALPFSADELRNSYGFYINPDVMTRPYIFDWMLNDFFHDQTEEAKREYLTERGYGRWELREFVDTQAKVESYFSHLDDTESNRNMRDALMGLIDDVLFIEDPYEKGHYHPRIAGQFTYQYRALDDRQKEAFNRLYNDFFYHRHNDFWRGKAMWKLPPLIDSTKMLCCAEDLGMIPDCVPEVMSALDILSLEIQRMPKDPQREFGDTWHYPYFSVCTTSTHDMGGIRSWWEEDRAATQRFYNNILGEWGEAPQYAEPWICDRIIRQHLNSPSMLCILPLQDWLSAEPNLRRHDPREEQINVPANPKHYWRYRMHITLRQLLGADDFNSCMRQQIAESHR